MRSVDDYLSLIPPLNANFPQFRDVITATVAPFVDAQTFLAALPGQFDLDTAIGVQLDAVGKWVGITRFVPVPILQKWFSLGVVGQGLGEAPFRGPQILATRNERLDDGTYRRLIRAKIKANYSNGLIDGAQAALSTYFTAPTLVFIADYGIAIDVREPPPWLSLGIPGRGLGEGIWKPRDPTQALDSVPDQKTASLDWTIGVVGTLPSAVDLYILARNLIPVHPAGVRVKTKVTTVSGRPLFGLGMNNQYIAGLGTGAWGASPEYIVQNIL